MKPVQIVAIAVRLFAITLIFGALRYVARWGPYVGDEEGRFLWVFGISLTAFTLIIALLLWKFPNAVARRIVPRFADDGSAHSWTVDELYGCGFVLLGVYFLFYSVSDGIFWAMHLVSLSRDKLGLVQHTDADTFSIVITGLEISASIAVIIGARGLTNLVFRLRYGNVE
jgi:hypothetical protein